MEAREFFDLAHENFRASAKSDGFVQDYSLGGASIRIEFANQEMFRHLGRAVAHSTSAGQDESIDLTIRAWDSSQTKMVPPPWSDGAYGPRGEIQGFNSLRFHTAFDHGSNSLSMIDHERRSALFWTPKAGELPDFEMAAPFRTILGWILARRGSLFLHAAALFSAEHGVLLAGPGGAGKSTTALLCHQAGGCYLADDYCAISWEKHLRVHSLYNSAKLFTTWLDDLAQFSTLPRPARDRPNEKQVFFLHEVEGSRLMRSAPCHALLLPRLSGAEATTTEPATPAEALRALAPSSIFQSVGAGAPAFDRLVTLVRQLPAFWLNLGRDMGGIANEIGRCLANLP